MKSHWRRAFLAINSKLGFSQASSFHRMLMTYKNFHFTSLSDKSIDKIFLKSPETLSFLPDGDFLKKIQLLRTTTYGSLTPYQASEKTNEPILKSPETLSFLPDGDFKKKIKLLRTTIYGSLTPYQASEKTNEPIMRKFRDKGMEAQTYPIS